MRTRIPGAVGTLFALDMAVKQYIEENVSETEEKSLCGTGILIRKVYNKGFAFNSMDSEPEKSKESVGDDDSSDRTSDNYRSF